MKWNNGEEYIFFPLFMVFQCFNDTLKLSLFINWDIFEIFSTFKFSDSYVIFIIYCTLYFGFVSTFCGIMVRTARNFFIKIWNSFFLSLQRDTSKMRSFRPCASHWIVKRKRRSLLLCAPRKLVEALTPCLIWKSWGSRHCKCLLR